MCSLDAKTTTVSEELLRSHSHTSVVLRKKCKVQLPQDPEQFRMRMRVEMNCWTMLATKYTNRGWLKGITPTLWGRYCDHFLGPKCYTMAVPTVGKSDGTTQSVNPPWVVVLNYELACRRHALIAVFEKEITFMEALQEAMKCTELKEMHFTSPIALMGRAGSTKSPGTKVKKTHKEWKAQKKESAAAAAGGKVKGGGKASGGKGKGTKGSKASGLLTVTPDGREICFNFNGPQGCSNASCARVHVCRRSGCLGPHSMVGCNV